MGPFVGSSDLLVIALPLAAPGLDAMVVHTDGVVLVDGIAPAMLDPARVIAVYQPPQSRPLRPPQPLPSPPDPAFPHPNRPVWSPPLAPPREQGPASAAP